VIFCGCGLFPTAETTNRVLFKEQLFPLFALPQYLPPNVLALSRFARHRGEPKNPSQLPDITKVY
jgi:hypothetical protein